MDTSFAAALEKRARVWLPPATVMRVECAGDASGDPGLLALLEEIQQKALAGEDLCAEPYEAVVFDDRVLLRCAGCPRAERLPRIAGIGRGRDAAEARKNALYALTLPLDHPNASRPGCLAALAWGEGPAEDVQYACVFDRVAYAAVTSPSGSRSSALGPSAV